MKEELKDQKVTVTSDGVNGISKNSITGISVSAKLKGQLVLVDYFQIHAAGNQTAEEATGAIGWLNNHGPVRKIFDEGQIAQNQSALAYATANMTCWTTHQAAFHRLQELQQILHKTAFNNHDAIIAAHIGATASKSNAEITALRSAAEEQLGLLEDLNFWRRLSDLLDDIEPIAYATNICQSDDARPDVVLLAFVEMCKRLERQWKTFNQPLMIVALILNPYKCLERNDRNDNAQRDRNQKPNNGRLFRMVEEEGDQNSRLFKMVEVENSPKNSESSTNDSDSSDQHVWDRYNRESSDSDRNDAQDSSDHGPWGRSQWTSDAADENYLDNERTGFMREEYNDDSPQEKSPLYEHMGTICANHDSESVSSYDTCPDLHSVSSSESSDDEYEGPDSESESEPESVLRLDFGEYLRAMKVTKENEVYPSLKPEPKKAPRTGKRPIRTSEENRCLAAFVEFNGVQAFALFDSGSTSDAISPDFARNAKLRIFQLENPVTLQLGTKGSRSRITYGCTSPYTFKSANDIVSSKDYFDIANIDRYDVILGTVFMGKHGLSLHFEDDTVQLKGIPIPTLSEKEEVQELTRRYAKNISLNVQPKDCEKIEVRKRPRKYGVITPSKLNLKGKSKEKVQH
ncbi:hypothetical protein D9758_014667 [Tetrapyrgos nigripes]|uniref:Uncharacterized protein n=1 Tax=Tetrapyrgos nigripes TaxID=182062 RepID=A0A8H5CV81_9AGAR|nr:hypothetical protein D9758_014667 [Tetrapyrgos nigripes]